MKLALLVVAALLQLAVGARNFTYQFQLQTSITDAVTCTAQANNGGNPTNSSTNVEYKYKYDNTQFFWAKPVGESEGCYKFTDRADPSYTNFPIESNAFGSAYKPGDGVALENTVVSFGTCQSSSYEYVASAEECQILADQRLDLNISRADPVDVVNSVTLPRGCSYKVSDSSVSFNTFDSRVACTSTQTCICRGKNNPIIRSGFTIQPALTDSDFENEKKFEWLLRRVKVELYEVDGLTATIQPRYTQEQFTYFLAGTGGLTFTYAFPDETQFINKSPRCFGDRCLDSVIPSFVEYLNSRPVLETFNQNATESLNTIPDLSRVLYSNGTLQNFTWTGGETAAPWWRTSNTLNFQFRDAANNYAGQIFPNPRTFTKSPSSAQLMTDWSSPTRSTKTCPVGSVCLRDSLNKYHFYILPSGVLSPANQESISCPSSMVCECSTAAPTCYELMQNQYAGSFVWASVTSLMQFEYAQRQAGGSTMNKQVDQKAMSSDPKRLGVRAFQDPVSIDYQSKTEQLAEFGTPELYNELVKYKTEQKARSLAGGLYVSINLDEAAAAERSGAANADSGKKDLAGAGFILMAIFWAISLPVSIVLYGKLK